MNIKSLFFTLILSGCMIVSLAQEVRPTQSESAKHTIFLELGGNGIAYSLNYDRLLSSGKWFSTSARAGVFANWWNGGALGFPLEINGLLGKQKHFLEIGAGAMYSYGIEGVKWLTPNDQGKEGYENYSAIHVSGRIGYRFQKPEGGFFFKAAYTPMAKVYTDNPYLAEDERGYTGFWGWFGIGIGLSF